MRIIDLFSGIGGFSLAASWVWGDSLDIACFCERDEFCRQVLCKHWPHVPIVEDVYDTEQIVAYANRLNGDARRYGSSKVSQQQTAKIPRCSIDIICAGFPCQPASCAGQRKGTSDDRWLWPPLLEAIRKLKSRWLLLENVPGLLTLESGLVFERCCADLEAEGYEVQPLLIPACGVNAPHRRERLWIVGHSNCHAPNAYQPGPQKREVQPNNGRTEQSATFGNAWDEHWVQAFSRLCDLDARLSEELDQPKGWRVNSLRALGNSIVPQVAARIMLAIKEAASDMDE